MTQTKKRHEIYKTTSGLMNRDLTNIKCDHNDIHNMTRHVVHIWKNKKISI